MPTRKRNFKTIIFLRQSRDVALAVLRFTVWTKLASNLQICLILPLKSGIKGIHRYAQLLQMYYSRQIFTGKIVYFNCFLKHCLCHPSLCSHFHPCLSQGPAPSSFIPFNSLCPCASSFTFFLFIFTSFVAVASSQAPSPYKAGCLESVILQLLPLD